MHSVGYKTIIFGFQSIFCQTCERCIIILKGIFLSALVAHLSGLSLFGIFASREYSVVEIKKKMLNYVEG